MKISIKPLLCKLGFELRRIRHAEHLAGSHGRPIGNVLSFLQDIKSRGFVPRGIIDLGANEGAWTRMALSVFQRTPVLMVEPQEEMMDRLAALVREHPYCEHIPAGAGRRAGQLVQTIWDDLAGSSFLPPVDDASIAKGKQRLTRIMTLDGILDSGREAFHPDLVKIDIQGFELEALAGGESLFGRVEVFIIEASLFQFMPGQPLLREIIMFMADHGYEVYDLTGFLRRPKDGALGQVDLAFVKANGRFRCNADW